MHIWVDKIFFGLYDNAGIINYFCCRGRYYSAVLSDEITRN